MDVPVVAGEAALVVAGPKPMNASAEPHSTASLPGIPTFFGRAGPRNSIFLSIFGMSATRLPSRALGSVTSPYIGSKKIRHPLTCKLGAGNLTILWITLLLFKA